MAERADQTSYRQIGVRPVAGALGAEIEGVNLADLDDTTFAEIHRAFLEHQVLFFLDQRLTPEAQTAFARRFGTPHRHPYLVPLAGHPDVIEIVKRPEDEKVFGGDWHADLTYEARPTLGAVLYAREVPARGGDTLFASMYAAYDGLSPGLKRLLSGLSAVHDNRVTGHYDRRRTGSMAVLDDDGRAAAGAGGGRAAHPVVARHPETGRPVLFVSELVTTNFVGMSEAESEPLLGYLFRHLKRPEFTCRFRWRAGSVALWDNRCTQHLALNDYPGQRRVMQRVLIAGEAPKAYAD